MQLRLLLRKSKKLPVFLYIIFLLLYRTAIGVSSLWNPKAKKWLTGRKDIFKKIQSEILSLPGSDSSKIIWIHCSSLGEFEQGKPIMEKIRAQGYQHKIVLTFFSPSGYEVKKNYPDADSIFYLPIDSRKNARKFIDLIKPSLVIFIKYDYWYFYLDEIKKRKIKCLLISALFRKDQAFFKWYGRLHREMLECFTQIFVQNEESKRLLETIHINNCTVSGDTRFDAVIEIANKFQPMPVIEDFIAQKKCIVAGSTWTEDEVALQMVFDRLKDYDLKLIIAPHEVHEERFKPVKKSLSKFSKILCTGR